MRVNSKCPESDGYLKYKEALIREEYSDQAIPRIFVATLEGDLTNSICPGDLVTIKGSVEIRTTHFSNYKQNTSLALRCQSITSIDGKNLNSDIQFEIRKARRKWLVLAKEHGELVARDILIRSSFQNVRGLDYTKLALLLLLTGSSKRIGSTSTDKGVRNQSHILLVGDPGTAKSRLLQYVAGYKKPSIYTCGIGCTAAGLTAACIRTGSEWTLEAGVLVLCDGGVCCIDEWNLLKPTDQDSIHEAMEQQVLSMAKAGNVTKLSCRCSIVAATNPKKDPGEDDLTTNNIGLSTSLISRFDLIFAIRDQRDDSWDVEMADFRLTGREKAKEELVFDEDDIRAHLFYAQSKEPVFSPASYEILGAYFGFCRKDEFRDLSRTTIRLQESLMRLAASHARLLGREVVTPIDAVTAVILMESSMGFGRLMVPLNLIKTSLPLEPSRINVLTILKRLRLECTFSYRDYNWVSEEEVGPEEEVKEEFNSNDEEGGKEIEKDDPSPEEVEADEDDNFSEAENASQPWSQLSYHAFIGKMQECDSSYTESDDKMEVGQAENDVIRKEHFEQKKNSPTQNENPNQGAQPILVKGTSTQNEAQEPKKGHSHEKEPSTQSQLEKLNHNQKDGQSAPNFPEMEWDSPVIFKSQKEDEIAQRRKLIVVEDLLDDDFDYNLTQILSQQESSDKDSNSPKTPVPEKKNKPALETEHHPPKVPYPMDCTLNLFDDDDDSIQEILFKQN